MKKSVILQAQEFYNAISGWIGEGGKPVHPDQAQARANVCLKCPHNVNRPIEEFLKDGAALTAKRLLELKSKMNLRVQGEKSLHLCELCGCVLRLKVHEPLKFILEGSSTEDLIPECWVNQEKNQL